MMHNLRRLFLRTMLIYIFILVLSTAEPTLQQCHFPESATQSFFFDIRADTPIGSVIVDSVVEPADSQLRILDIRSNNLKGDFVSKFEIEKRQNGQFILLTTSKLNLPAYPSTLNETTFYLTIECNHKAYPLISIRIRNYNSYAPKFLNTPYEMILPQDTPVGTIIPTQILALDEDPQLNYTITYSLVNAHQNREFQIIDEKKQIKDASTLPVPFNSRPFTPDQLPRFVQLRVLSPLRRKTYYLNVNASDNQNPPKETTVVLKIMVGQQSEIIPHFTQLEYHANFTKSFEPGTELILNQPLMAIFPNITADGLRTTTDVKYELINSKHSSLYELNSTTGRLYMKQKPFGDPTEQIELEAYLEFNPEKFVKSKIILNDISEVHLTYFAQCHYDVHLAENSPPNTRVARFVVRGDISGIDLLNGTEYFDVDLDGTVKVAKDAVIDYEETDQIIITARLKSSSALHPKSLELCQIASMNIHVDDENDHSPKFEQSAYTFYTDEYPYNNTEIGVIKAVDDDKGEFGKVHYRILDEYAPFILFEADSLATLYFVSREANFSPERSYTFTVEAFDAKEYPRTARVNVRVLLQSAPSTETAENTTNFSPQEEKLEKPKSQFRTLGAVSVDHHRIDVDNQDEVSVTVENPEFEVSPGTFGEKEPPRFEQQNYNFTINGQLEQGQYIGTIRLMQLEDDNDEDFIGKDVEYTVEEGIKGFVNIDPEYGTLKLDSKLIEDSYEQIRFAAQARKNGRILVSTVVSVYMNESEPIYAQDPQFEQALYRFELEENLPGQNFARVIAHHRAAELGKDNLWYTLSRDKDSAAFRINPESGQLRSLEPLDAEAKKFYSLKINSCLGSNTTKCGHAEAIIVIKDLNDNEPQFTQPSYNLKLPPDLSVGTDVLQVQATDKDSGKNAELRYELLPSHAADYFKINEHTGQITLIKSFSKDELSQLRMRVGAKDMAEPPLMGLSEIYIELTTDAKFTNEHAPEFDDFRYEFSKSLPIPSNTLVARVHATDPDEGENGRLWYRFAEETPISRRFIIDKQTGEIRTANELNTELSGELVQLLVEVHDSSTTFARKSDTVVLIHLLGERDERLEFLPLPKTVYISSSKPLGSTIFKVGLKNANFKDVHYTVEQELRSEYFAMIDDLLVVQSKLRPGSYRITIKAQAIPRITNDKNLQSNSISVESHSLRMIVMTDRDKYPVFDKLSYELKISSNANFPVKLPGFNATVHEGRVGYSLYNAENLKGIKIDSITGELTIFEEFVDQVADDHPRGMVFVVVRATNLNHPAFFSDVGVRLGLMSSGHELVFSSRLYRLITKENVKPGTVINTVKIGILEPEIFPSVKYTMQPNELFDIQPNGSVVVKQEIDLEALPPEWKGIVEATVTARHIGQSASAQIQIKIEDVNEFSPKFDKPNYVFSVDSQLPEGSWIGQLNAKDEDFTDLVSGLTYRATMGDAVGLVNVTRDGKLILNPGVRLEPGRNYSMIIEASDAGKKVTDTAVQFQVFDSSGSSVTESAKTPQIVQMPTEKWVPEKETDKMILPTVSLDGNWEFQIAGGDEMDRFVVEKVNKTTAQLGLKTEHLNANDKSEDLVVLEITNVDDPFERLHTNISVDLNKVLTKKLEFADPANQISLDLSKIKSQNDSFYRIPVKGASIDSKNDLRFELTENPLGLFRIDSKSGDLYAEWPLDQLIQGDQEILVTARLGKQSIQRVYTVQISGEIQNDSVEHLTTIGSRITVESKERLTTPESENFGFASRDLTFDVENPTKGQQIGKVEVSGAKGPLQWKIEPAPYRQWFDIDQSGVLSVKDVPFELKGRQRAEFTIQVLDLENVSHRDETHVSVDLILPEEESTKVPDQSAKKTTLNVVNKSTEIESSISSVKITLTTPLPSISTDETPVFDSTPDLNPPATTITVIPDLMTNLPTVNPSSNDHILSFKHAIYHAMLPEKQYGNRGSVVNLKPSALKEGLIDVVFGIESSDPSLPFFVRNYTGELIAFDNIDREKVSEYKFNVTARSLNDPTQIARAEVRITILDVNDNYPQFVNPPHLIPLNSNARPGQVVGVIKTIDSDEGANGRVSYKVVENPHQLFDINSNGEITLTTKIPALPDDILNVTIEAVDGGRPALRVQHLLQIQIFAEDENYPHFRLNEYSAEVSKDAETGTYVTQVVAGVEPLNYLIIDDHNHLFSIDNKGLIHLSRKPTPSEQNRYHTLTVIAENSNGKTANTTINVFIEGEPIVVTARPTTSQPDSTEKCQFTAKTFNAEIKENTVGRIKLTTVKSNCPIGSVKFSIHQATKEFEIDEKTGDVYVIEPLDREKKGLHLVVVNISLVNGTQRHKRQPASINPIAEFVKNKLAPNQALVLVKVLDENDNAPVFTRLSTKNRYVFTVDWQAPLLQPIARVQAVDPDERPQLKYTLPSNDYFIINETSGVIMVQKSLLNVDEEVFDLEVRVSDGKNEVKVPLKIYKLAPGLNIAIVTVNAPETEVDELQFARKLTQLLEREIRVLVKQVYIGEDGHADPKKTHLFVYALDRETKKPLNAVELKSLLDKFQSELQKDSEFPVSSISLPITSSSFHLTITEMILLGVSACLLILACCMLLVLLRCCKRKTIMAKPEMNYMVESRSSDPRPYNVELISRKTAQQVLSARPLPDSLEEVTMSPDQRASMLASAGIYNINPNPTSTSQRTISSTVTDEMPVSNDETSSVVGEQIRTAAI